MIYCLPEDSGKTKMLHIPLALVAEQITITLETLILLR
jgi:hypothetical protein